MNETELERLIVRLTLDANGYQKDAESAINKTLKIGESLNSLASQVQRFEGGLINLGGSLASALGASASAGWMQANFEKFQQMEVSQIRMRAAIENNGRASAGAMAQYSAFAERIDAATGINKGQTLSLIQMAERMGVVGEDAQRLAQNSIALGAAMGQEPAAFIRVAQAMETGNATILRRRLGLQHLRSDSDVLAAAERMLSQGWETQQKISQSASGVMAKFGDALKAVKYQFGEIIANAILPTVRYLTGLIEKFKGLDDTTKKIVVGVAILVTGILALPPAIMAINAAIGPFLASFTSAFSVITSSISAIITGFKSFTSIAGILGLLANPFVLIGVAIVGVIGIITALVVKANGLKPTWDSIKNFIVTAWNKISEVAIETWSYISAKFEEFVTWSRPLWIMVANVAIAVWNSIQEIAITVWGAITSVWNGLTGFFSRIYNQLFGATTTTWTGIRDFIVDTLIMAEFQINNFGAICNYVWTSMKLGFVSSWNYIEYVFTTVIPAILSWFSSNWRDVFTTAGNMVTMVMTNMVTNVGTTIRRLPELIRGEINLSDIWTPLTEGFTSTIRELPNIPAREMGALERELENSVAAQGLALGTELNRLRAERNREINAPPGDQRRLENEANNSGMKIGAAFNSGYKKEADKLEVALLRSAEGLARIKAYMDRVKNPINTREQSVGATATARTTTNPNDVVGPVVPAPVQPFSPQTQQTITEVARAIPREITNAATQGSFGAVGNTFINLTGAIGQLNNYLGNLGNNQLAVVDTNNFTGI